MSSRRAYRHGVGPPGAPFASRIHPGEPQTPVKAFSHSDEGRSVIWRCLFVFDDLRHRVFGDSSIKRPQGPACGRTATGPSGQRMSAGKISAVVPDLRPISDRQFKPVNSLGILLLVEISAAFDPIKIAADVARRIAPDRFVYRGDRLGRPTEKEQRLASLRVSPGKVRIASNSRLERRERTSMPALGALQEPLRVVRQIQPRIDAQRCVHRCLRSRYLGRPRVVPAV
jgi:hypothetical protein